MDELSEDYKLLRQWGVIHRKTVTWRDAPDYVSQVTSGKHSTSEAAIADAWEMARRLGYTEPKWWQWWRWREERPSPVSG